MTDENREIVRKAKFETEDGDASEKAGSMDARGHFAGDGGDAPSDDGDGRLPQSVRKGELSQPVEHGDDWDTGPDSLTETSPADADANRGGIEKDNPRPAARGGPTVTPERRSDERGIFETEADVLRDIREQVRTAFPNDGRLSPTSKAVEKEGASDGELSTAYRDILDDSEAVLEEASELVEADDAADEDWAALKERVDALAKQMQGIPEPETAAEVAAIETLRNRAAKLRDLLDPEDDSDGEEANEPGGSA